MVATMQTLSLYKSPQEEKPQSCHEKLASKGTHPLWAAFSTSVSKQDVRFVKLLLKHQADRWGFWAGSLCSLALR